MFFTSFSALYTYVWGSPITHIDEDSTSRRVWLSQALGNCAVPGLEPYRGGGQKVIDQAVFDAWCLEVRRAWALEQLRAA